MVAAIFGAIFPKFSCIPPFCISRKLYRYLSACHRLRFCRSLLSSLAASLELVIVVFKVRECTDGILVRGALTQPFFTEVAIYQVPVLPY